MNRFLNWFRNTSKTNATRRRTPLRARLEVEPLEDRCLPTILFQTRLDSESKAHDNNGALSDARVHLIFWGPSATWTTARMNQFTTATTDLLSTDYLSKVTQYGSNGRASYVDSPPDTNQLPSSLGKGNIEDETERVFDVSNSTTDIYVVLTPTDSQGNVYPNNFGPNAAGSNWVGTWDVWNFNMIWVGKTDTVDNFTWTLSHELAEEMSSPNDNGFLVNPGSRWSATQYAGGATPGQIGDYEPNLYAFRMPNGIKVQPYWSNDDNVILVPDGTSAVQFVLNPIWDSSVSPFAFQNQYDLTILGSFHNQISMSMRTVNSTQELVITVNGETAWFDEGRLGKILLGGGPDTSLTLDGFSSSAELTIAGNNLRLIYGSTPSSGTVKVYSGTVTVVAEAGQSAHNITVTSTTVKVDDNAPLQYGLSNLLRVESRDCQVAVLSTLWPVSVVTTPGDIITVGNNGFLWDIFGPVSVEGGGYLFVDDSADFIAHTGVAMYSGPNSNDREGDNDLYGFIDHLAPASISYEYNDIQNVTIDAGRPESHGQEYGDTFYVEATGIPTQINTGTLGVTVIVGSSNDTQHSGPSLDPIQGVLTVTGQGGRDTLNLQDQGATQPEAYTLEADRVRRSAVADIKYNNIQTLVLTGGSNNDLYDVQSSAVVTDTTFVCGTGSNQIYVGGRSGGDNLDPLRGTLTIQAQGNDTNLTVNDWLSGANHTYTLTVTTLARDGAALIRFLGPFTAVNISGDSSRTNTLAGIGFSNWSITANNGGHWGGNVYFAGMQNLVAGSVIDRFSFMGTPGQITGSLTGGILDYSNTSATITVNLGTHTASRIGGTFSGVSGVTGSTAGDNTLTGDNTFNNWSILGPAVGLVNNFSFSNIQNLVGGTNVDVFKFSPGGSVASIDGGGAPAGEGDWLDYSAFSTAVTVNLATGLATGVNNGAAGAVQNIQDVHGGSGSNTLTGNDQGNILVGGGGPATINGGAGRSLLLAGGGGGSYITGGSGGDPSGGDILIGGTTAYDLDTNANLNALMTIFAEWQSSDSAATRFTKINQGLLPGNVELNYGTTVFGGSSTLIGASGSSTTPGVDWFFAGPFDTMLGYVAGDHQNNN
jgi:hypothetical protein